MAQDDQEVYNSLVDIKMSKQAFGTLRAEQLNLQVNLTNPTNACDLFALFVSIL